jgi:hypothetical protein
MEYILDTSQHNDAMYTLKVSQLFGDETGPMFHDIIRMVSIQFMIQLMFSLSNPEYAFATSEFIAMLIYIVLGVSLYWLIMRKLVAFK